MNGIKTLPDTLGNLQNLKGLDLFYNELNTLPDTIGNLNLEYLNLGKNSIEVSATIRYELIDTRSE